MLELFLLRASFLGCLCPKLFHLFVVEEFVISVLGDGVSGCLIDLLKIRLP